jgi:hypothetical protein
LSQEKYTKKHTCTHTESHLHTLPPRAVSDIIAKPIVTKPNSRWKKKEKAIFEAVPNKVTLSMSNQIQQQIFQSSMEISTRTLSH